MNWLESLNYIIQAFSKRGKKKPTPKTAIKTPPKEEKKPRILLDLDTSYEWEGIVWHHSATRDTNYKDWDGIRKYHTSYRIDYNIVDRKEFTDALEEGRKGVFQRPWSDIGYHGGVEMIEGAYEFTWGRPLRRTGAHAAVKGVSNFYNKKYIGMCAIGNYDAEEPPAEMWDLCLRVTRTLMDAYNIPGGNVIGHREVYGKLGVAVQKSCPGTQWNLEKFRDEL